MKTREYIRTNEYCDNVILELEGWKERVDGIVTKLDHRSTGEKEKVVSEVNELHIMADELDDRLKELCATCTTNFEPHTEDHNIVWPAMADVVRGAVSVSDIGG